MVRWIRQVVDRAAAVNTTGQQTHDDVRAVAFDEQLRGRDEPGRQLEGQKRFDARRQYRRNRPASSRQ